MSMPENEILLTPEETVQGLKKVIKKLEGDLGELRSEMECCARSIQSSQNEIARTQIRNKNAAAKAKVLAVQLEILKLQLPRETSKEGAE